MLNFFFFEEDGFINRSLEILLINRSNTEIGKKLEADNIIGD